MLTYFTLQFFKVAEIKYFLHVTDVCKRVVQKKKTVLSFLGSTP